MLKFVITGDGSKTIYNPEVGENYHSKHGAVQESRHVFLNSGLHYFLANHSSARKISILEVGLGTGLNFLLTADFCTAHQIRLNYTGIEAYPLYPQFIAETNYKEYVSKEIWASFLVAYPDSLNQPAPINNFCHLHTAATKLLAFKSDTLFDVLYFDAFAAIHQPEMWTYQALAHVCQFLKPGGIFVTYAITGDLKRTMKSLGFNIEKAKGAPGKREMLRAIKI